MVQGDLDFYLRENIVKLKQNKNIKCWIILHKFIVQAYFAGWTLWKVLKPVFAEENKHQRSIQSFLSFLVIISVPVCFNFTVKVVFRVTSDCLSHTDMYTHRTAESHSVPVVQYHCAS